MEPLAVVEKGPITRGLDITIAAQSHARIETGLATSVTPDVDLRAHGDAAKALPPAAEQKPKADRHRIKDWL